MTYYVMHIIKDKNNLRTFINSKDEIFLEICNDDSPEQPEYICLDLDDARNLKNELAKMIVDIAERQKHQNDNYDRTVEQTKMF